jgi:PKD repeat protein
MAIWNYGDGIIDTVTTFPNQILVPDRTHIYTTTGVYFPTLTLVNRGTCDTSFTKRIVVSPKVVVNDTTPYYQDFQASPGDWFQDNELVFSTNGVDSLWEWGLAAGQRITTLQESNLVWVTDLDSSYRSGEKGWVLSPCFDIGTLRRPMVALDIWRDTREGVDGVIMQYFDKPSQSWMNLGVRDKGINWYNPSYVIASPGDQVGAPVGWSGISNSWEDARYRLDVAGGDLRGQRNLRFRLAFASSPQFFVSMASLPQFFVLLECH